MRTVTWCGALTVGLFATIAHAEGPDHDKAVATFDEARALIDAGNCEVALPKLEDSMRYEASVGALLSLADCWQSRDPLRAWTDLREAERLAYLKHDERSKIAHDRAAALEAQLAIVRVTVPPAILTEPGLELRVDGVTVDRYFYLEGVLAMKAGPHLIEASVPHKKWAQQVVAQPSATTAVIVRLENEAPPPVAPVTPHVVDAPRDFGGPQKTAAIVLGGLGLASLVAGGTMGVIALMKKSDINSACGGAATTCRSAPGSLDSQVAEQQTFTHLSTVAFVTGGVLAATGFVLYLTAPKGPRVAVTASATSFSLSGRW